MAKDKAEADGDGNGKEEGVAEVGAGEDAITDGDVADVEEEANEEAAEEEDNDEMPVKDMGAGSVDDVNATGPVDEAIGGRIQTPRPLPRTAGPRLRSRRIP